VKRVSLIIGLLVLCRVVAAQAPIGCMICEDPNTHDHSTAPGRCPDGKLTVGRAAPSACQGGNMKFCQLEAMYKKAPAGCKVLQDMRCLGWSGGNKTQFCQSLGYNGNTNPTIRGYKTYSDGGLCFAGEEIACRIAAGESLKPDPATGCKELNDMKSLGWTDGHKGNFCRAHGYNDNYNPDSLGYVDYRDGGLCFKGTLQSCTIAAEQIAKELKELGGHH
jgi:hypothetical protein